KQTFVEVGTALDTIRAGRLYRAAFPSFEAYLRQRWGFSRATAYRMMEAAEVAKNLSQVETNIFTASAPVPANVAQAQALSGLPPEKQPEAWQRAQEIADGPVTAADVREAVKQVQPPPPATSPAATAAPGPAPAPPPATAAAPSATPAPPLATAPAGQPPAQAPSAMVHCLIAEADYDWLLDQGLTMAQA